MIRARLTVKYQFEKDENGEPKTEHWGEYDFAVLPRVGEFVDAFRDGDFQTVIVRQVIHSAVECPVAHPDWETWRKTPQARLIADWHWSD